MSERKKTKAKKFFILYSVNTGVDRFFSTRKKAAAAKKKLVDRRWEDELLENDEMRYYATKSDLAEDFVIQTEYMDQNVV